MLTKAKQLDPHLHPVSHAEHLRQTQWNLLQSCDLLSFTTSVLHGRIRRTQPRPAQAPAAQWLDDCMVMPLHVSLVQLRGVSTSVWGARPPFEIPGAHSQQIKHRTDSQADAADVKQGQEARAAASSGGWQEQRMTGSRLRSYRSTDHQRCGYRCWLRGCCRRFRAAPQRTQRRRRTPRSPRSAAAAGAGCRSPPHGMPPPATMPGTCACMVLRGRCQRSIRRLRGID